MTLINSQIAMHTPTNKEVIVTWILLAIAFVAFVGIYYQPTTNQNTCHEFSTAHIYDGDSRISADLKRDQTPFAIQIDDTPVEDTDIDQDRVRKLLGLFDYSLNQKKL